MCIDVLFALFAVLIYAEPLLARIVGKAISNLLLVISALGLCSLMAVFFVEAL